MATINRVAVAVGICDAINHPVEVGAEIVILPVVSAKSVKVAFVAVYTHGKTQIITLVAGIAGSGTDFKTFETTAGNNISHARHSFRAVGR